MKSLNSSNYSPSIKIAAAGSTPQTVKSLKALADSPQFQIVWVMTPAPKKIGRRQILTKNPVQKWIERHNKNLDLSNKNQPAASQTTKTIKLITISEKIDQNIKQKIKKITAGSKATASSKKNLTQNSQKKQLNLEEKQPIDLLLVVDFGYFIPDWLLELPRKATVNLHPSKLPKWRGGSPGQMVILSGQKTSVVTLMRVTNQLDAGPIIKQKKFEVQDNWTSQDYYDCSFDLAAQHLTSWLKNYVAGKFPEKKQPVNSPTKLAREIQKQDAYLPWELIVQLRTGSVDSALNLDKYQFPAASLLKDFLKQFKIQEWAELVERASRAFRPWPILWTKVNTKSGKKRMQIIECKVDKKQLLLQRVKIAGQVEADWNQVKNAVLDS